jgi:hypothetical protein
MAGLATSRMIGQILQVLRDGSPGHEARSWRVGPVACSRDRHRHAGASYTFGIEVLQAHIAERGHPPWRLAIVSERWWAGDSDVLIRDTTWLKLIAGKAADVVAWLKAAQR